MSFVCALGAQLLALEQVRIDAADGRLDGPALKGADFTFGTYEWTFGVGDYFASVGVPITVSKQQGFINPGL